MSKVRKIIFVFFLPVILLTGCSEKGCNKTKLEFLIRTANKQAAEACLKSISTDEEKKREYKELISLL